MARWAKKPGEAVRKDEILVELETDKVSLEVAAPGLHRFVVPLTLVVLTLLFGYGLSLGLVDGDRRERFVSADGSEIVVDVTAIESRLPLAASVMPSGLAQGLSDDDLRDLLTLLAE